MEEYVIDVQLLTLPCFHFFHYDCIEPWFKNKSECPVCRVDARESGSQAVQVCYSIMFNKIGYIISI